jgi:hypothetical protein
MRRDALDPSQPLWTVDGELPEEVPFSLDAPVARVTLQTVDEFFLRDFKGNTSSLIVGGCLLIANSHSRNGRPASGLSTAPLMVVLVMVVVGRKYEECACSLFWRDGLTRTLRACFEMRKSYALE